MAAPRRSARRDSAGGCPAGKATSAVTCPAPCICALCNGTPKAAASGWLSGASTLRLLPVAPGPSGFSHAASAGKPSSVTGPDKRTRSCVRSTSSPGLCKSRPDRSAVVARSLRWP